MTADKFAFPKQRKEPINDADHVRNAIARFDQVGLIGFWRGVAVI
ncbi:MAG: DUF6582 domain-containing protein [Candidatus Dormibacteraceae bacterium]